MITKTLQKSCKKESIQKFHYNSENFDTNNMKELTQKSKHYK